MKPFERKPFREPRKRTIGCPVELWCGRRKVHRFEGDPQSYDLASLMKRSRRLGKL